MKSCIKDCGSLANTAGINSLDISQCRCVVNYNWDTLTNTCTPNLICGDGFLAGTE